MSDSEESISPVQILEHVDELLRNNVFKGNFKERKFVPLLNACRDVIVIHNSEKEFIKKVREAVRFLKFLENFKNTPFIGITEAESEDSDECEFLFWTSTAHDHPFGDYLFCIPGLVTTASEICVSLLYVRRLEPADLEPPPCKIDQPVSEILSGTVVLLSKHLTQFVLEVITYNNLKSMVQFLSALLLTIFVSLGNFTYYFGEFLIKFMRELSIFMEAATPVFFGFLHVLNNAIYGLYTLILCLFKSNSAAPFRAPPPPDQMAALRWKNERMKAMQCRH